jgi:hypothetical protein
MCFQIRNIGGCYLTIIRKNFFFGGRLREHKNIYKNMGENENFRDNENFSRKLLRNLSRKQKLFAKIIAKSFAETETFRENRPGNKIFSQKRKFSQNKISRKVSEFSLFSLFAKMKKGVFVSTLGQPHCPSFPAIFFSYLQANPVIILGDFLPWPAICHSIVVIVFVVKKTKNNQHKNCNVISVCKKTIM